MLTLTDVRAGYGGSRVLQGIDLDVPGGSVTALMGRNGMGKTTLLRTIMGLVRADGGRIRLDGRDIAGLEPHRVAGRGVGYVPQGREIFADLTVAENLRLGLLGRGLSNLPASHAVRFPMLVARAGQRAGALSGGQQQILAIARALVAAPRVLLLDEPSEGIQPSIVADIARLLAAIVAEDGITVLLVEQNVDLVFALAQRCAFLENGRVVAQHAVAEARADPGLLARHLAV